MEEIYDELEVTQKVLKEAAAEMLNLVNEIKEERVLNIHSIVTDAQEYFKEKRIDTGITLLQKAQNELKKKSLIKTRKKVLAGLNSEVKKIQYEIEKKDPAKSYTFDNVILACPLCNNAKSNLISEEDWRRFFAVPMRKYYEHLLDDQLENDLPVETVKLQEYF